MLETRPGDNGPRQAGALAARGRQLTSVASGDEVAPDYLHELLETSAPGVVPVGGGPPGAGRRSGRRPGLHQRPAARTCRSDLPRERGADAGDQAGGKLVPTGWAAGSLPEAAFWAELQARTRFRFGVPRSGAESYRGSGPASGYDRRVTPLLVEIAALRETRRTTGGRGGSRTPSSRRTPSCSTTTSGACRTTTPCLVADVRRLGIQRFPWPRGDVAGVLKGGKQ